MACAAVTLLASARAAEAGSADDAGGSQLTPVVQSVPSLPDVTSLQVRGTGGRRLEGLSGTRLARAMTLLGGDDPGAQR